MDGLTKLVTSGNAKALNLVKSALTSPLLINTEPDTGPVYSISLEAETFEQDGSAQVSENLLIIQNGKQNIADNVAPGSWSWYMSGYIPGSKLLEPTNYFTPIVLLNTDIVKRWFERGTVLIFKDMNAQVHKQVVIQSLKIIQQKDCRNKAPFSMSLKELNTITGTKADKLAAAVETGVVAAVAVTTTLAALGV